MAMVLQGIIEKMEWQRRGPGKLGDSGGAFPRRRRQSRARGARAEREQLNAGARSHDMPEILHW